MTENERYGGKDYVEKTSKGEGKQRAWIAMITKGITSFFIEIRITFLWPEMAF